MNTTKSWFGLLILFFIVIISLSPILLKYYLNLEKEQIITYEQKISHSCHINVIEPAIVIRMDDVRAFSKQTEPVVNQILNHNLSVVLGVIPAHLNEDTKIINYLKKIKENPRVEIAQHGVYHNQYDMYLNLNNLNSGREKIITHLGVTPVSYVAPYNKVNESTRENLSKSFRIISSSYGYLKEGENIAEIGYNVETYDYKLMNEVPVKEIIGSCEKMLQRTNLCVIMLHPQEFSSNVSNPTDISLKKMKRLDEIINGIENLNASTTTFNNLVQCEK